MDIVAMILAGVGAIGILVSSIWLIVCAFKKSVVWGLVALFVPFGGLVYVCMDWGNAMKPFLINVAAVILMFGGVALSPSMQKGMSSMPATTTTVSP